MHCTHTNIYTYILRGRLKDIHFGQSGIGKIWKFDKLPKVPFIQDFSRIYPVTGSGDSVLVLGTQNCSKISSTIQKTAPFFNRFKGRLSGASTGTVLIVNGVQYRNGRPSSGNRGLSRNQLVDYRQWVWYRELFRSWRKRYGWYFRDLCVTKVRLRVHKGSVRLSVNHKSVSIRHIQLI